MTTTCFEQMFGAKTEKLNIPEVGDPGEVPRAGSASGPRSSPRSTRSPKLDLTEVLKTFEQCAHLRVSHLTSPDVRALEVRVEEDVEVERGFLGI